MNKNIDNYILENKDILINIINEINNLLSEKYLQKLSNLYDIALNNCLNRIDNETKYNKNLTENYFISLTSIISDTHKIQDLIEEFNPIDKALYILGYIQILMIKFQK